MDIMFKELRQKLKSHICDDGAPDHIKHVTIVGALLRGHQKTELNGMDACYVDSAVSILKSHGIALVPDYEIDLVNLEYGRDFLAEKTKTDLIVFCVIFSPPLQEQGPSCVEAYANSTNKLFRMSQHSIDAEAWRKRILQSNARYVVTFGSEKGCSLTIGKALMQEIGSDGCFTVISANERNQAAIRRNLPQP